MNIFAEAFKRTMKSEGLYSFDPVDRGGETFMGIARNFNPEWAGWDVIDECKDDSIVQKIPSDKSYILNMLAKKYYREVYWSNHKMNLDVIASSFPNCSIELFDIAVNMGVLRAATFLQRALNILNRDEKLAKDLKVDGFCGQKTFKVINKYINEKDNLLKVIILLKAKHYIDIVESNTTQEKFIRGWINRIHLN